MSRVFHGYSHPLILCNVTCCSTFHKKPVARRRLPPIKLQLRCEDFCLVFISSTRTTPRRSPTSIQRAFSSHRLHHRGKNNTALVIIKHHHGQFYIMSASWEWCFIAWGWVEHPPSHSLLSLSLWIFFFFPGKLRYLWGSDARQCCSLLNSWHSIHAAIHLKRLSAFCTICHHKQQEIFPAWIITEVIFFIPLNGWLSKLFVSFLCGKHHLPGTASCSKQMPKNTVWPEFGGLLVSYCACIPPSQSIPSHLNSLDGISWCAAQSRRTWAQCWYDAAVLRQNSVALSLIETSQRPISTDGCHMYANKEQSESRSPISTTCLPHTATPKPPFTVHAHTHAHSHWCTHYQPSKSLWRDKSLLYNPQLYNKRSKEINMTLIIILFFFFSRADIRGWDWQIRLIDRYIQNSEEKGR